MLHAVHIADGLLSHSWLIGGAAICVLMVLPGWSLLTDDEIPRIGLVTSALFVASQLHLPLGVGSVHLLLNALAGILLGRFVGIAILIALTFQAMLFGHGGYLILGVNAATLGIPALIGFGLFRLFRPAIDRSRRRAFPVGFGLGLLVSSLTVALNGAVIALGLENGGREAAIAVVVLHLPVIGVESVATGVLLAYLVRVKPEMVGLKFQSSIGVTSANGTSH